MWADCILKSQDKNILDFCCLFITIVALLCNFQVSKKIMFKWRWVKDWFSPREVITENSWSNSLKSFLKVCKNWLWFLAFSLLWQIGVPLPRDAVFYVVIPSSWRISFPVTFIVILLLEKIWKTPHDFSYWLTILAWLCATVHVNNAFLVQWLYLLI